MTGVLWLRRDLSLPLTPPRWPDGIGSLPFTEDMARQIHGVMLAGYAPGQGSVANFEEWWPALKGDSEYDPGLVFVAQGAAGEIAGVCQCWTSGFVKDLVVAASFRGRGLGEALMLSAFEAFLKRGAQHVDLKVLAGNDSAIRLYRRLGMREG